MRSEFHQPLGWTDWKLQGCQASRVRLYWAWSAPSVRRAGLEASSTLVFPCESGTMAEKPILPSADHDRTQDLQANQRDLIEQTTELKPLSPGQGPVPGLPELRPSRTPGSMGRLGHYEVLEVLGQGGFGIVLKAFDDKLQRLVAIKVLGPHLTGSDSARRRFVREARAGAAVSNDHVVAIYAVDEQPIPYMVMEYIAGQTPGAEAGPVRAAELKEVLRIGQQVADGLAAAHAVGLIHRDIKPGNILLEDRRRAARA